MMKKNLTGVLMALVLACAGTGAAFAAESETETEAIEVDLTLTEGARPDYTASDYVTIDDEAYRELEISVYPPADESAETQSAWQENVDTLVMTQLYHLYSVDSYPQEMLDYIVNSLTDTYEQYAAMYGQTFEDFLKNNLKLTREQFDSQAEEAAEQTLTQELILRAIAEKENITVTDEEFAQEAAVLAGQLGYDSADALLQVFDEDTVRISILMEKTLQFVEDTSGIDLIIETETESEGIAQTESET